MTSAESGAPVAITYHFRFADGSDLEYAVRLDPATLEVVDPIPADLPFWAALEFNQCANCTLRSTDHPYCPAAARITALIQQSAGLWSHDRAEVRVVSPQREITKNTTVQTGMGSLLGLIMATSGCPRTVFLRPMARFHLPFATDTETIYRATSMYLLAQYFVYKSGHTIDFDLHGLKQLYHQLQTVNTAMAARLRGASDKDAAVNGIILLDLFAKVMPLTINESLEEIRALFTPLLDVRDV